MEPEKQKTAKKHLIFLTLGVLALLSLISLTAPSNRSAPAMPADLIHEQARKIQECLNCHANTADAIKPMKHPPQANCGFCHVRK
jgi:hypothetical protein